MTLLHGLSQCFNYGSFNESLAQTMQGSPDSKKQRIKPQDMVNMANI